MQTHLPEAEEIAMTARMWGLSQHDVVEIYSQYCAKLGQLPPADFWRWLQAQRAQHAGTSRGYILEDAFPHHFVDDPLPSSFYAAADVGMELA